MFFNGCFDRTGEQAAVVASVHASGLLDPHLFLVMIRRTFDEALSQRAKPTCRLVVGDHRISRFLIIENRGEARRSCLKS
jgi:hypothetical protein